jgi:type I restriction enzyme S subunit
MVNMGELYAFDFISNQSMALVPLDEREIERFSLRTGDLLFARQSLVLEGTGKCSIVASEPATVTTFESHLIRVRLDATKAEPRFYFYFFGSPQGRAAIQSIVMQVAAAGIRASELATLEIPVPPLPAQRKIAAVLCAYDDLIENNSRRIKLLEEMAQRIYREWFVDFRYPGHQGIPLVDSELGPLPGGWTWVTASEALTINPRILVDRAATRPFVPMTSVSEHEMHITPIEERVAASGSKFVNGDTLFARITPCLENGKTAYVQCLPDGAVASGSTEFIVLRSQRLSPELTYLLARDERFRSHAIQSMSGATGRQRVREECFESFWLAIPPEAVIDSFAGLIRPMFTLSFELFRANSSLRTARDLLLPRLISGEIDLTDLDIAMPEAAA